VIPAVVVRTLAVLLVAAASSPRPVRADAVVGTCTASSCTEACSSPKSHPACFEPKIAHLQKRTASDRPADARSNASLGRVSTLGFHCQPAGQLMSRQWDSLSSG
jgi:hypothetical protein